MGGEAQYLINADAPDKQFRPSPKRWLVLALASWIGWAQCAVWSTYSPVPAATGDYYGIQNVESQVNLLLAWGPIILLPVSPAILWLLTKPNGLRNGWKMSGICITIGALLRCLPSLIPGDFHKTTASLALIHISQIVNAAGAPIVLNSPAQFSNTWFPSHQRAFATSCIYGFNTLGQAGCLIIGPSVVKRGADIPAYIYLTAIPCALPGLISLFWFPDHPDHAPSYAAASQDKTNGVKLAQSILAMLKDRGAVFTGLACGFLGGVGTGWLGVFQFFLDCSNNSSEGCFTNVKVGWLGFINVITQSLASLLAPFVVEKVFKRRIQPALVGIMAISAALFVTFTFQLPNPIGVQFSSPSFTLAFIELSFMGLLMGAFFPLCYELGAEYTYPLAGGYSSTFNSIIWNVSSIIMLGVVSFTSQKLVNFLMAGSALTALVLVGLSPRKYKRMEAEAEAGGS